MKDRCSMEINDNMYTCVCVSARVSGEAIIVIALIIITRPAEARLYM